MNDYERFVKGCCAEIELLPKPSHGGDDVLQQLFASSVLERSGTWAEFGVGEGISFRRLMKEKGQAELWGFDSFAGLPEDWREGYPKGMFAHERLPLVPKERDVHLVTGLFEESLPSWRPAQPITLLHLDCDLYESAACVLRHVERYLERGCVLVFDELVGYEGFERHEMRALFEARGRGLRWTALHRGPGLDQAASLLIHSSPENAAP